MLNSIEIQIVRNSNRTNHPGSSIDKREGKTEKETERRNLQIKKERKDLRHFNQS